MPWPKPRATSPASGARPIAATNCLNFGSPEKPEVMWQFCQAIDGLSEACTALGTPITGGNVSFYNETLGKSIYPTPVIGVLGILDDASKVVEDWLPKRWRHRLCLLDGHNAESPALATRHSPLATSEFAREFSSGEYSKTIAGVVAGEPPAIDLAAEKRLIECLVALATEGAVQSAHDISDGGLAVTLAESCFASVVAGLQTGASSSDARVAHLNANIKLDGDTSAEHALFGERGARAVVSVKPTLLARLRDTARQYQVAAHRARPGHPRRFVPHRT